MTLSDCFVSVVAPLSDDGDIVDSFVREVSEVLKEHYSNYELVLVDDGSRDDTVAVVRKLLTHIECVRLITFSRPFGTEVAISAGLDTAIGDYVVVALADSDPPKLIPHLVERSRKDSRTVVGVQQRRGPEPVWNRLGARLFYWYCNRHLKLNIPQNSTYFRVLSRQAVNAITQIKDRTRFLRSFSAQVGFPVELYEYEQVSRRQRPRQRRLMDAISLAVGIIVANSTHPLRMVSWLGFGLSALNLLYMGYVLLVYLFKKEVAEGWATLSLQNAVMFFCLFLFVTVLCEYIGRIVGELRTRPHYYTLEEHNSSVVIANEDRKNVTTQATEERSS
jgi:glycosyltransferase involved in cell wall biosynthesis